jgi:hypothetical protein
MVLFLLRDGSHIEVPRCHDVIRKLSFLVCVDAVDAPLLCLPTDGVLAYTMNQEVAASMKGEDDTSSQDPR